MAEPTSSAASVFQDMGKIQKQVAEQHRAKAVPLESLPTESQ